MLPNGRGFLRVKILRVEQPKFQENDVKVYIEIETIKL